MGKPSFQPLRGRQPTIEWVPITEIWIDDTYQRSIETPASKRLIQQIAEKWDWDVFDVLKLSRRPNDDLYVIDGQHRLTAAVRRGDIPQLPCVIKRCSGPQEEAHLFIAANRGRKAMGRLDDYRAAVGAGDEVATTIERLVTGAGLQVAAHEMAKAQKPGEISSVGAIRTALKKRGELVVGRALSLIGEAFPDEVLNAGGALFGALVELIAIDGLDQDQLFQTLLTGTTAEWATWADLANSVGGQGRIIALRGAIAARYGNLAEAA